MGRGSAPPRRAAPAPPAGGTVVCARLVLYIDTHAHAEYTYTLQVARRACVRPTVRPIACPPFAAYRAVRPSAFPRDFAFRGD